MSSKIKINIFTELVEGPWGGGNQFLKALKNIFQKDHFYEEDPSKANIFLFNSHHNLNNIIKLKKKYHNAYFVHRIDGPMSYRGKPGLKLDKRIYQISSLIADGVVYQSDWSCQKNQQSANKLNYMSKVIHNAPNPDIFYSNSNSINIKNKIKLIATSWSNNPNKGYDIYHYLDRKLDFKKYKMRFIGRIDSPFKNIEVIDPLPSIELSNQLRNHDIFIFASKIEACSNSLLEALHCGLPAVARSTSSNPEILGRGGELFNNNNNVIDKIDIVSSNYQKYKKLIKLEGIQEISRKYYLFFEEIMNKRASSKKITFTDMISNYKVFS